MKNIFKFIPIIAAFVACGGMADAQQAGKIPRIGFLDRSTASSALHVDQFRQRDYDDPG